MLLLFTTALTCSVSRLGQLVIVEIAVLPVRLMTTFFSATGLPRSLMLFGCLFCMSLLVH
nr:MAG TPA: hypothetical protein [Caudoviricetes sp.]